MYLPIHNKPFKEQVKIRGLIALSVIAVGVIYYFIFYYLFVRTDSELEKQSDSALIKQEVEVEIDDVPEEIQENKVECYDENAEANSNNQCECKDGYVGIGNNEYLVCLKQVILSYQDGYNYATSSSLLKITDCHLSSELAYETIVDDGFSVGCVAAVVDNQRIIEDAQIKQQFLDIQFSNQMSQMQLQDNMDRIDDKMMKLNRSNQASCIQNNCMRLSGSAGDNCITSCQLQYPY